ncbi:hypothetical protein CBL_03647 [Carabus blaptoides fortunei]
MSNFDRNSGEEQLDYDGLHRSRGLGKSSTETTPSPASIKAPNKLLLEVSTLGKHHFLLGKMKKFSKQSWIHARRSNCALFTNIVLKYLCVWWEIVMKRTYRIYIAIKQSTSEGQVRSTSDVSLRFTTSCRLPHENYYLREAWFCEPTHS